MSFGKSSYFDITNGTAKAKIKILNNKLQSLADKKEEGRKIRSFKNPMDGVPG